MSDRPLHGRTVAVTRAAEQSGALAGALGTLGATVVDVPLVRIEPVEPVKAVADGWYDWLLLASANAAAGARRLGVVGQVARVGVVGPATARAWGAPVEVVASPSTAAALVAALPPGPGRVLVVQGDRARPDLVDGMRTAGWTVDVVVAYRTVTVSPDGSGLAALRSADAVTFASPSAVEACAEALATAGARLAGVVVAIGPTTAAAVRAAGWADPVVAEPHTAAGLVTAVVRALTA